MSVVSATGQETSHEAGTRVGFAGAILGVLTVLTMLVGASLSMELLAAQPALNVYFQSTLKDTAYQKATFDRVAKKWKSPASSTLPKVGTKTVVQAVIARDGRLVSATVSMESGSAKWDEAARAAVRSAAPFSPLPADYRFDTVQAHFHFALK